MQNSTAKPKYIKVLIAAVLLVALILLGNFIVKRFIVFGVISAPRNVSSATLNYTYTFNRELEKGQDTSKLVYLNQDIPYSVIINNKSMSVYLKSAPDIGKEFEVKMSNIESSDGHKFSHSYKYKIKYKATKDLSKKELQESINRSDSFENSYPIIKSLPLNSKNYQLGYRFPDKGSSKMPISINCITIRPLPTDPQGNPLPDTSIDPKMTAYLSEIQACRNEAIEQLKQMKYDDELYQLVCKEPVLLQQFNCTYVDPSLE